MRLRSSIQSKLFKDIIGGVLVFLAASSGLGLENALADGERKIKVVQKEIQAGHHVEVDLKNDPIERVDVVLRRTNGGTETQLSVGLEDSATLFGGPQQVDKNEDHVLRFEAGSIKPKDKDLILNAINGNIFVESVHVFYGDD